MKIASGNKKKESESYKISYPKNFYLCFCEQLSDGKNICNLFA